MSNLKVNIYHRQGHTTYLREIKAAFEEEGVLAESIEVMDTLGMTLGGLAKSAALQSFFEVGIGIEGTQMAVAYGARFEPVLEFFNQNPRRVGHRAAHYAKGKCL